MSELLYDDVEVTVEIGFATTGGANKVPLGADLADIVWTDVSEFVREVQTQRGRDNELDDFSTGTMSAVLSNADRRFDPENSGSPYFGAVTPGRPVRVQASYDGGTAQGVFFGWIDQWDQQYDQPNDATVTITASDAFKVLNLLQFDKSWDEDTRFLQPLWWLRFGETEGNVARAIGLRAGVGLPLIGGSLRPGDLGWRDGANSGTAEAAESLLPEAISEAALLDGKSLKGDSISFNRAAPLPIVLPDFPRNLEFVFSTELTANGSYAILEHEKDNSIAVGLVVSGGVGRVRILRATGPELMSGRRAVQIFESPIVVNDGQPHMVHVFSNDLATANVGVLPPYVDGQPTTVVGSDESGPVVTLPRSLTIARPFTDFVTSTFPSLFRGVIDEVIFHSQDFDIPFIQNRYGQLIGTSRQGEATGDRVNYFLDLARWPSDGRDISAGLSRMSPASFSGQNVLEAVKDVETAEQGRLFVNGDGEVQFLARHDIYTQTPYSTSQATFGDEPPELPYSDITFSYDDRLIINKSLVSRNGGNTFVVEDVDSQSEYFVRTEEVTDLQVDSDAFAFQVAHHRVASFAEPELRIEALQVKPRTQPADLFDIVLGFDIGTRITVKRRPQNVGAPIEKELLVESVSHTITPDEWITEWSVSPAPLQAFILDSATNGILDTSRLGL
jgi:hypothetical protein